MNSRWTGQPFSPCPTPTRLLGAWPAPDACSRLRTCSSRFRFRLRGKRSRANEVVDLLFGYPVLTVKVVVNRLGVTPQGATLLLRQLVAAGIVDEPPTGRGRRARFTSPALLEVLVR